MWLGMCLWCHCGVDLVGCLILKTTLTCGGVLNVELCCLLVVRIGPVLGLIAVSECWAGCGLRGLELRLSQLPWLLLSVC